MAKNESFGEFEVIPTKHELFGEASPGSQVIFDGELKVLPTHNAPGIISLQKHMGGGEGYFTKIFRTQILITDFRTRTRRACKSWILRGPK